MNRTKGMIIAAFCSALCVVLPMTFHVIPNAGSIFLPMHIPVPPCGRVFYGVLNALIFRTGAYSLELWLAAAFTTALPGIAVQLVFIPLVLAALERSKAVNQARQ